MVGFEEKGRNEGCLVKGRGKRMRGFRRRNVGICVARVRRKGGHRGEREGR